MRLVVSRAARADLKGIGAYTAEKWGEAQKARYLSAIRERFGALRNNPALGRPRADISEAYRSLPVGRHMIFYRIAKDALVIVRVLHQSMDVRLHL
jgi:toxin ParE1/3/4